MKLFICEKPSQAKDIAPHVGARTSGKGCITGADITVTWCIGHLLEQAPPEHYTPELKFWSLAHLPVVPIKWQMLVKDKTASQYWIIQQLLKDASEVVIATDADREGECIAREVLTLCGFRGPIKRLWLGALDATSIKKALGRLLPNDKTLPMYWSGMGRARADWLAGMNLTMGLTKAFGSGKGAEGVVHCGRVQTPVLALIVRRERAIAQFKPKTHWELAATFEICGSVIPMKWQMPAALADAEGHCIQPKAIEVVIARISGKLGRVADVKTTPKAEQAPLLYSLSALQRDGSARFGLKAQAVLDAAQALYETHKATSYPRSDCEYLPSSMQADLPAITGVLAKVSTSYAQLTRLTHLINAKSCFNDAKVTAHHAIVPTANPNVRIESMSKIEALVYDMIVRRYLAQFIGDFQYNETVLTVECAAERFRAIGKMPLQLGWKLAYPVVVKPAAVGNPKADASSDDDEADKHKDLALPSVEVGAQANNKTAALKTCKTKPPKRYTEGTLLGAMESIASEVDDPRLKKIMQTKEKAGIGTDATRASIIEGLYKRNYIEAAKKCILPSERGMRLIELLERVAPAMTDAALTAVWEDQLAKVEAGTLTLDAFERQLGGWLGELMATIKQQAVAAKAENPENTASARPMGSASSQGLRGARNALTVPCASCRGHLRRVSGKTGYFWGCSGFRDGCKATLPDNDGQPGQASAPRAAASSQTRPAAATSGGKALNCPNCQKPMLARSGSRGPFYGCSGYPACKATMPMVEEAL